MKLGLRLEGRGWAERRVRVRVLLIVVRRGKQVDANSFVVYSDVHFANN